MPQVTIIGVHPIETTDELLDEAITQRHGLVALDPDPARRAWADFEARQRLRSIVVVEMLIAGHDRQMYMGDFGQSATGALGDDDAVAYDEVFLSPDGEERVADFLDQVKTADVRVAFFLHDYRAGLPILTSYGPAEAPMLTPMPARLRRLISYRLPGRDA